MKLIIKSVLNNILIWNFQIYPGKSADLHTPPVATARALSELYTWQCSQWVPIQNSQIIGIYKEIPVHKEIRVQSSFSDLPPLPHCHVDNSYNFSDCQLYQVTLPIDSPWDHTAYCSNVSTSTLSCLRNIQRRIVMQICLLVCNIYIYI